MPAFSPDHRARLGHRAPALTQGGLARFTRRLARIALRRGGAPWLSAARGEDVPAYIGVEWEITDARPRRAYRGLEGFAEA